MKNIQTLWTRFKVQISFIAGAMLVAAATQAFNPANTAEPHIASTVAATTETNVSLATTNEALVQTVEAINEAALSTTLGEPTTGLENTALEENTAATAE
jgi:hypothetical protein